MLATPYLKYIIVYTSVIGLSVTYDGKDVNITGLSYCSRWSKTLKAYRWLDIPAVAEMHWACYYCYHQKCEGYSAVYHLHEHSPHHLVGCSVRMLTCVVANVVAAK